MPNPPPPAPFLFGKLPAHGDFVARGLAPAAQQAWDDWASGVIERMRSDHGPGFDEAHETLRPLRFVAGPSQLGAHWRAGALAPSIDSAGRRFLLVLGVQDWSAARAASLGWAAAEALEHLIYQALAASMTADEAQAAIAARIVAIEQMSALAADALDARPAAAGVWWPAGEAPLCLTAEPGPDLFRTPPATLNGEYAS